MALTLALAAPATAPAVLSPGPEIPVSATGVAPAIAPGPDGSFTIAWSSDDGDESGIYARRFAAAGAPLGGEIAVNTTTAGNQSSPVIATGPGGGFIVAWQGTDSTYDPDCPAPLTDPCSFTHDVYARGFDAAGAPLGGEIAVNTTTAGDQSSPVIAPEPGGGFTVAWTSSGFDEGGGTFTSAVYARRFDAAGDALGGEISVSGSAVLYRISSLFFAGSSVGGAAIASDDGSGGFTVAWTGSQSGYVEDVYRSTSTVYARRFDAGGDALGGEIAVSEDAVGSLIGGARVASAVIASDRDGGFTVAWHYLSISICFESPEYGWYGLTSSSCSGSVAAIYARRFGAAGDPLTGKIHVSNTQAEPTIAAAPGGGFTVAWDGVYVRRFDAAGAPVVIGFENTIPVSEAGGSDPAIADDGSGGFTVAWEGTGIHARHFSEVDAPDTRIDSGPRLTNNPAPTFTFTSSEGGSDFECRVDSETFAPCSGPSRSHTLPTPVADGEHIFEVRATDGAGRTDPWPAGRTFTVDTAPPDTSVEVSYSDPFPYFPYNSDPSRPFVHYHSTEGGSRFECRLFAVGETQPNFGGCASTEICGWFGGSCEHYPFYQVSSTLPDGDYIIEVRATDPAANTDPTPAAATFTIDTTGPEIQIDSGPSGPGTMTTAVFAFSSPDDDLYRFSCRLSGPDESLWTDDPCNSPRTYADLADGDYTFEVRAEDLIGNLGAPVTRSFTVDTEADTQIDSGPEGLTNDATPTFEFSSEAGATFECQVDGGGYSTCSSPHTTAPLPDGPHTFEVRATDALGNTDPTPALRSFTVDTEAPGAPTLLATDPASPANDNNPRVTGSASEGTVRLYTSADCSGPVAGEGSAAAFADPGIGVSVADDSTTTYHATATDAAGNASPCSTSSISYTEDSAPPETSIDSGPSGPTDDPTPTFEFSSEAGATFECQVDGGGYSTCSSPHTTAPLPDGPHTFEVRATDALGNTDPTPALRSFTVDTEAPVPPASPRSDATKPATDTVPPDARLFGKRGQVAGEPIEIEVSCAEDCALLITGKVLVWGGPSRRTAHAARRPKARFGLTRITRQLSAGHGATVKLKPTSKEARRRLRRLVGRGGKARAAIRASYRDRAGNSSTTTVTVRLQRK